MITNMNQPMDSQQPLPNGYQKTPDGKIIDGMGRPVNPAVIQSWQRMRGKMPTTFTGQQQQQQPQQNPFFLQGGGGTDWGL